MSLVLQKKAVTDAKLTPCGAPVYASQHVDVVSVGIQPSYGWELSSSPDPSTAPCSRNNPTISPFSSFSKAD